MSALLLFLLFIAACLLLFVGTRRDVSPALAVALVLAFLFWYAVPIVTTLAFWSFISQRAWVSYDVFVRTGIIEMIGCVLILALCALPRRTFRTISNGPLSQLTIPSRLLSTLIVAGTVADFALRRLIWSIVGGSYLAGHPFVVTAEGSAMVGMLGILAMIEFVLRAFLYATAIIPAARRPRIVSIILWGGITGMALLDVFEGTRMQLLAPCILALMYVHSRRLSRA